MRRELLKLISSATNKKPLRSSIIITLMLLSIFTFVSLTPPEAAYGFQPASKLVLTASPSRILTGGAYSWLTVQLQDANGNPALAPSDITVSLSTSDSNIVTLTSTSFTIPAGSNYARSTWWYNRPRDGSPFAKSTFTPGTATITAIASGLTSSSVTITTSGAGGSPTKIFLFPEPSIILADKSSIAWLTVQLLDASGNPSVAPSDKSITLSNSDPIFIVLSVTSVTIGAGQNYVTGHYDAYYGSNRNPYCTSTYKVGSANVTASSSGLESSIATIKTSGKAPAKVVITASPIKLLTGGWISWLTIQLVDAYGNPALAPSDITISLSNSAPSVVALSVTSIIIGAGQNYVTGHYDAYYGSNRNPYCTSTYTPGSAIITASASGFTPGSIEITTSGAGGAPTKIALLAQPTLIRADGSTFSWLTVQLQDDSGKPSIAPSDRTISLKNSNPTAVTLTSASFTIPTGSNYARSTWWYNRPRDGSPFAKSTFTPGTATITANSTGLIDGIVTISSSELPSLSVILFNNANRRQSIFNSTDMTRIGAHASGVELAYVKVTIKNPTGRIVVNNVSMTPVSGLNIYNYKYDYSYTNALYGKYTYTVRTKDAAGNKAQKYGSFMIMTVSTTDNGPWSASKGEAYNASFTISIRGSKAKALTLYVDIPYWHAVAFAELNSNPVDFSSTISPHSGHRRFSITQNNVAAGQDLQVKFTIIVANKALTGSRTIYYHAEWSTTQNYHYAENEKTQTVLVT